MNIDFVKCSEAEPEPSGQHPEYTEAEPTEHPKTSGSEIAGKLTDK